MLISTIIDKVLSKLDDSDYSADDVLLLINAGRGEIAGKLDLPNLLASDTVTTLRTANEVALPLDYGRGLWWVWSENRGYRVGSRRDDYHNLARFYEINQDLTTTGQVTSACVEGLNLLYQGRDDDTLTLKYFEKIEIIDIADIDTKHPTELPDHLQLPLLQSYCLKELFDDLEDAFEGPKRNSDYYQNKYEGYLVDLQIYNAPMLPKEPVYIRDTTCPR